MATQMKVLISWRFAEIFGFLPNDAFDFYQKMKGSQVLWQTPQSLIISFR
jgi:hypothetical protein